MQQSSTTPQQALTQFLLFTRIQCTLQGYYSVNFLDYHNDDQPLTVSINKSHSPCSIRFVAYAQIRTCSQRT